MPSIAKLIISCLIGNILEFYDFILYGVFSVVIALHFFPSSSPAAGLTSALTVLAVGSIARPIGGALFGHFGDKYSRRKTLIISLLIMGVATTLMGLLPSYAEIGITATILLVLLRLIQGLTVEGESAGSMVFLLEQAQPAWRATLSICVLLGAMIGVLLALFAAQLITRFYSEMDIIRGAWRIPFLCGVVLALVGIYLRSRFWHDVVVNPIKLPVKVLIKTGYRQLIHAILFLYLPATFTAFSTIYLVPYLTTYAHFTFAQAVAANSQVVIATIVSLLVAAYLSDRFACHRAWVIVTLIISITVIYPLLYSLKIYGIHGVVALIALIAIISLTMGPEVVLLCHFFKKNVRYSGVGLSHGLAFSAITSTAPLIFHYLARQWGMVAVSYYLIVAAVVSLLAVVIMPNPARI